MDVRVICKSLTVQSVVWIKHTTCEHTLRAPTRTTIKYINIFRNCCYWRPARKTFKFRSQRRNDILPIFMSGELAFEIVRSLRTFRSSHHIPYYTGIAFRAYTILMPSRFHANMYFIHILRVFIIFQPFNLSTLQRNTSHREITNIETRNCYLRSLLHTQIHTPQTSHEWTNHNNNSNEKSSSIVFQRRLPFGTSTFSGQLMKRKSLFIAFFSNGKSSASKNHFESIILLFLDIFSAQNTPDEHIRCKLPFENTGFVSLHCYSLNGIDFLWLASASNRCKPVCHQVDLISCYLLRNRDFHCVEFAAAQCTCCKYRMCDCKLYSFIWWTTRKLQVVHVWLHNNACRCALYGSIGKLKPQFSSLSFDSLHLNI